MDQARWIVEILFDDFGGFNGAPLSLLDLTALQLRSIGI